MKKSFIGMGYLAAVLAVSAGFIFMGTNSESTASASNVAVNPLTEK